MSLSLRNQDVISLLAISPLEEVIYKYGTMIGFNMFTGWFMSTKRDIFPRGCKYYTPVTIRHVLILSICSLVHNWTMLKI